MDNYKDLGGNMDVSGLYVSPQIVKVIFQMSPLLINIDCYGFNNMDNISGPYHPINTKNTKIKFDYHSSK